uniref:Uncharacterized protein n=1 Tax=Leptobrachium leishanense TaxID=445787 RepID=A0A8C5QRZ8_9ANUR
MMQNVSLSRNCCEKKGDLLDSEAPRAAWLVTALSSVLIFTTVIDIMGSLLVIISVLKNRKLRNSVAGVDTGLNWKNIYSMSNNA